MVNLDIFFQGPNPFTAPTPIPLDPLTAAGGGSGIGNGTLIGLIGGGVIALIPIVKSWVDNKNNMAAQTTQTALNSHTAMLTSALQRADRLEQQLSDLQKAFADLRSEFTAVKTQLADKTIELASVVQERDELRQLNKKLELENDDLRATITRMELAARAGGWQPSKFETEAKT